MSDRFGLGIDESTFNQYDPVAAARARAEQTKRQMQEMFAQQNASQGVNAAEEVVENFANNNLPPNTKAPFDIDEQAIYARGQAIGRGIQKYSPYVVGAGIAADTLFGDDRWDRKAVNLTGNAIGAAIGNRFGPGGRTLGALAGGWLSDRVADVFDDNDGKNAKPATQLLNQHLSKDPIMQIAMYEEQLRQSRLQQKEMEKQMMAMARMQVQSPQSSYSQAISGRSLPTFTSNGTMVNPYENMGM